MLLGWSKFKQIFEFDKFGHFRPLEAIFAPWRDIQGENRTLGVVKGHLAIYKSSVLLGWSKFKQIFEFGNTEAGVGVLVFEFSLL